MDQNIELYNKLKEQYPTKEWSHVKTKESFKKYYDEQSKDDRQLFQKYNSNRMGWFVDYLKDPIIELGCHMGFNLFEFAKKGFKDLTGIDCGSNYIKVAKERYNIPQIKFIESFIEDLPEDKKYKTIILTEILEHVIDPNIVIQKAKRILEKGGYIFIACPDRRLGSESHLRGIGRIKMECFLKINDLKVFKWFNNTETNLIAQHE